MYKVHLQLYIWNSYSIEKSANWVVAYKTIEIPFPPFIGLELNFPLERCQVIKKVAWNIENGSFRCTLEDKLSLSGIDDPVFDEWIEYYEENKWIVLGPYPQNE